VTAVAQPSGTVTLVFTDIEGSTRLLEELGATAYREALAEHRRIVREACARHAGYEVDYEGDAFFYAFASAQAAVASVSEAMRGLDGGPIRIRVGIHTGEPELDPPKYVGLDVHRAARIMAAAHGGQVLVSAGTAALAGDGLRDLGEHRFKDLSAPERVFQLGEDAFPPLRTLQETNLPIPPTPFLGRKRELGEVLGLLSREDVRLLTLTGPGGTGKTRLAAQAAAGLAERYPAGVWWVPLAALQDPSLVVESAGQALGASNDVAAHIADKRLLLLLDNFEHVIDAASALGSLLGNCPSLELLVTSRAPLRLSVEQEYRVPPFVHEEGVGFFIARARAVRPDFEANGAVGEICRRLDELPLALELAAARVKSLSPRQILERLEQRLPLLTGGARDLPDRQQTLRATIAWSYDLLTDEEQTLVRRMAVFAGGCTLEAAEAVAQAGLDCLQSLVDKSLVRFQEERYWMLDTIREFADEQLSVSGEGPELRRRHAEYFLSLAEALEPPLVGVGEETSIPRLLLESGNLRAALDVFAELPDTSYELRLVGTLFRFWEVGGMVAEGRLRADAALARAGADAERALRLKVLYAISLCAFRQGDAEARNHCDAERLVIARQIGDGRAAAVALNDLGNDAAESGDFDTATERLEECRALARELTDDLLFAVATDNLAWCAIDQGDYTNARALAEEAVAIAARMSDSWRSLFDVTLGFGLLGLGAMDEAEKLLTRAIEPAHRIGGPAFSALCLDGLASVGIANKEIRGAARLTGAAETIRRDGGVAALRSEQRWAHENERAGRQALGDTAWEAAKAEGAAMSVADVLALAFEVRSPN
jgi:predicted ATPase/class 3 adenylate cyclase